MEKRILVTGGSGFIGAHLVDSFVKDGISVLNVDRRSPIDAAHLALWKNVDILDRERLESAVSAYSPTQVVHLAAETRLGVRGAPCSFEVNTIGVENVIRVVQESAGISRVLVASSMLVCVPGYTPRHDEDYRPGTPYGESKVETEKRVRASRLDCTWTIIRPTTIWGPREGKSREGFYRALKWGYYVHPGKKGCIRSYGFVGNIIHQIRRLLEAPTEHVHQKTFYVGDPPIDALEFVSGFSRRLRGKSVHSVPVGLLRPLAWLGDVAFRLGWQGVPLTSRRLENLTENNVVDVGPTLALTGPPPYSVDQGIELTAQWVESIGLGSRSKGGPV